MRNVSIPVAFYGTFAIFGDERFQSQNSRTFGHCQLVSSVKKRSCWGDFLHILSTWRKKRKMCKCFSYQPSELMTLKIKWKLHNLAQTSLDKLHNLSLKWSISHFYLNRRCQLWWFTGKKTCLERCYIALFTNNNNCLRASNLKLVSFFLSHVVKTEPLWHIE